MVIFAIIGLRSETNTKKKTTIAIKPMPSIISITRRTGSGASAYSSLEPSNGGNGIILNTNSAILTCMKITTIWAISVPSPIPPRCRNTDPRIASSRLVVGPDKPTSATPYSPKRRLPGLNGTGLAIKIGGRCSKSNIIGSNIEVYKSR